MFPTLGIPPNGWFMMENPIQMDDLGENPLFSERFKGTFCSAQGWRSLKKVTKELPGPGFVSKKHCQKFCVA